MDLKYKKLCSYEGNFKSDLGYEAYSHIYVNGQTKDLKRLVNFIDENFIVYKDNIKWNEHEIHVWGNCENTTYLQITLNEEKLKQIGCDNFYKTLKQELESNFNDTNIDINFGLDYMLDSEKIENFIDNYKIDLNNLPLEKFSKIRPCVTSFPKLKEGYVERYYQIEKDILNQLLDKKLIINGVIGKFKKVNNSFNGFGFFKQRTRSNYYNFELNKINTLEFC